MNPRAIPDSQRPRNGSGPGPAVPKPAAANASGTTRQAYVLALVLAAHMFVLVPSILYFGNSQEFGLALTSLLKYCLLPALASFLLFALVARVLPHKHVPRYTALLAVLGVLVWAQSTFMVWDYGVLDGRRVEWHASDWRGWLDAGLWLSAIAAAVVSGRPFVPRLYQIGLAVFAVHLLGVGYAGLTKPPDAFAKSTRSVAGSLDAAMQFAPANNILHLVLDGFQADVFTELLEHPALGDKYRGEMQGFVHYREALSVFTSTQFSVPSYISGRIYDNQMEKHAFVAESMAGRNILNTATARGFEVDALIGSSYLTDQFRNASYANSVNINDVFGTKSLSEATRLVDVSMFRFSPHFLRARIYNDQRWLTSQALPSAAEFNRKYFFHTQFLNLFIEKMGTGRAAPVYKYIHVMNTHPPMVVDGFCQDAGKVLADDQRANVGNQARCSLDTVLRLLGRMKELGIYDSALILIHGDHGGYAPNRRRAPPILFADGTAATPTLESLASPMLAIKLPGAAGPLRESPSLVSLSDIPDTISDAMHWDDRFGHRSIVSVGPDEERTRRLYVFLWRPDEWSQPYAGPIQEFVIDGSHYTTPWRPGSIFTPPDR